MSKLADSAAGMRLAQAAIRAMADDDQEQALGLLRGAEPGELMWASATLASAIREVFLTANKRNRHRTRVAMRAAADAIDGDLLDTQLMLLSKGDA